MIPFDKIPRDKIAVIYQGNAITYGELLQRSIDCQSSIQDISDAVIFLPMKAQPETLYKMVACIMTDTCFVPIPEDKVIEKVNALKNEFSTSVLWDEQLIRFKTDRPQTMLPKDTLFIGFTSGTTGERKGFVRQKESWLRSFDIFHAVPIFKPKQYVTCLTPLHYSLGLYVVLQTLCSAQTYLLDVSGLDNLLQMPAITNDSQIFSVPAVFDAHLSDIAKTSDCHTDIILSGEVVSKNIRDKIRDKLPNANIFDFYGSSETSFIAYNDVRYPQDHCVGTLFPEVRVSIVDADHNIGEISIASPMNFYGYLKDGYVCKSPSIIATGDLGRYERQLFFYGRKDDRINRKGEKFFPSNIEKKLLNVSEIKDVFVYGYPDPTLGEGIMADIVWKKTPLSLADINQFLAKEAYRKGRLDKYVSVAYIQYLDSGKRCKNR